MPKVTQLLSDGVGIGTQASLTPQLKLLVPGLCTSNSSRDRYKGKTREGWPGTTKDKLASVRPGDHSQSRASCRPTCLVRPLCSLFPSAGLLGVSMGDTPSLVEVRPVLFQHCHLRRDNARQTPARAVAEASLWQPEGLRAAASAPSPYQHTHSKQWLAAPDLFTRLRQTLSRQPARTGATGTLPRTRGLPESSP